MVILAMMLVEMAMLLETKMFDYDIQDEIGNGNQMKITAPAIAKLWGSKIRNVKLDVAKSVAVRGRLP